MKTNHIILSLLAMTTPMTAVAQNDTLPQRMLSGSISAEANYGRHSESDPQTLWDLPHISAGIQADFGKGWKATAEIEYERFYEEGEWSNNFSDNFSLNKLYISKDFTSAIGIKGGIIEVPIGLVNNGGEALTIYDPENESSLLPMKWHETGIGIYGTIGRFDYQLGGYVYTHVPLKESRTLGIAMRIDYHPTDFMSLGVSSYTGSPCKSMAHLAAIDYQKDDNLTYLAFDFNYKRNGLQTEGSAIYCSDHKTSSAGIEAGYDVMTLTSMCDRMSLIPFVRYDGVYNLDERNYNKLTTGINFSPLHNLILKVEYSHRHFTTLHESHNGFNISAGYTLDL